VGLDKESSLNWVKGSVETISSGKEKARAAGYTSRANKEREAKKNAWDIAWYCARRGGDGYFYIGESLHCRLESWPHSWGIIERKERRESPKAIMGRARYPTIQARAGTYPSFDPETSSVKMGGGEGSNHRNLRKKSVALGGKEGGDTFLTRKESGTTRVLEEQELREEAQAREAGLFLCRFHKIVIKVKEMMGKEPSSFYSCGRSTRNMASMGGL